MPEQNKGSYMGNSIGIKTEAGVVSGACPIALIGHRYVCPEPGHQVSMIVTSSDSCQVMNRSVAYTINKLSQLRRTGLHKWT
ncbi:hypothetical protein CUZ56_01333 [Saezia sanguinis]|uniref:Uncharacterized protein n=1 Tax=Saezia sanguinis TaxID=1965230 RepID=A0A433SF73_9BURK|nr:hypothetical protein CUZ56_01333 [Saezia sanguinis]